MDAIQSRSRYEPYPIHWPSSMEIDFLRHYGFKPPHIAVLRAAYGPNLLPLQDRVIRCERLFEGESLVIAAPTSSGKTFLAEVLFLYYTMQGRNAVLLAPTKALAHQRYRQWRERYESMGYKVALSTRDHPFHDERIRRGDFHLAVVNYEKMRTLLAQDEGLAYSLGACIVDELHYVFDSQRGPGLEMLLTHLRRNPGLQMVGLSALTPDASLCHWLDAKLVHETRRPVELRQGVLCNGTFVYREFNSNDVGREVFPLDPCDDDGEAMLTAARYFASRGETTLLFWPTRDLCYRAARRLAAVYEPDPDVKIPELERLEATVLRERLADLLPRRIAVHTSDLSVEEREIVERAVYKQEVVIICATGTLAEGVNFPVVNVITPRRMYSTQPADVQSGRPPAPAPISPDRLWNMIGRAGRLGLSEFGRGMLLTHSPGDVDGLFSMYLDSPRGAHRSMLPHCSWSALILQAAPISGRFTRETLVESLSQTLCAQQRFWPIDWRERVGNILPRLTQEGFLREDYEQYELTPLGRTAAAGGLSIDTAKRLRDLARSGDLERVHDLTLLLAAALTSELEETYVYVSRNEILSHAWTQALARCADEQGASGDALIRSLLDDAASLSKRHHEAIKKALILSQWVSKIAIGEVEQQFQTHAGVITRLGEEAAWILGRLAEIAAAYGVSAERVRRVLVLQERALYGLPERALGWCGHLRRRELNRTAVLQLLSLNLHSPGDVHNEDLEMLRRVLSKEQVERLAESREPAPPSERIAPDYVVEIDAARKDRVFVNGQSVVLTPLQVNLFRSLAARRGVCVEFETLIQELWPSGLGDAKRIHREKNNILAKVRKALGNEAEGFILASKGIGLALNARVIGSAITGGQ